MPRRSPGSKPRGRPGVGWSSSSGEEERVERWHARAAYTYKVGTVAYVADCAEEQYRARVSAQLRVLREKEDKGKATEDGESPRRDEKDAEPLIPRGVKLYHRCCRGQRENTLSLAASYGELRAARQSEGLSCTPGRLWAPRRSDRRARLSSARVHRSRSMVLEHGVVFTPNSPRFHFSGSGDIT